MFSIFSMESFFIYSNNNILTNNTLNLNGHGIFLYYHSSGITIANNNANSNSYFGIYLPNSSNNILTNNITNSNNSGIYLTSSSNNALTGNTSNSNIYYGISVVVHSNSNDLINNTVNLNGYNGINISSSVGNVLTNNIVQENNNYDLYVGASAEVYCNNIITNTIGSGDREIKYLNSSISIQNEILSGLILCNADNSNINNVTINGSETKNNNGFLVLKTDNSNFTNINSSNNHDGIYLYSSENNILTGNVTNSNIYGILLFSFNNALTNNIVNLNTYGIYFNTYYSSDNTVTNNIISSNTYGAYIYSSSNNEIYNNNFLNNLTQVYVGGGSGNIFNFPSPIGGNYWSSFDNSVEGCNDLNDDKICDSPYFFSGGQDNLPWLRQNGWIPNQAPTISNLKQFKSDNASIILESGITTESSPNNPLNSIVVFRAILSDPDGDQSKLQIELKEYGQPFDGQNLLESGYFSSGNEISISKDWIIEGKYKWRARVVDDRGGVSNWQEFGAVGNVDFEIKLVPLYTQIRSLYPSEALTDSWYNEPYVNGVVGNYSCGSKIYQCGCAITSMIMLGRYYDINTALDNSDTNPRNINNWLVNNSGYSVDGGLVWAKGVEYLGIDDDGIKKSKLVFDHYNTTNNNLIDGYVNSANPTIVFNNIFGHYFIVDGKLKSGLGENDYTYTIKDPYWYNTQKLNQVADATKYIQGYNNYFQKANLFSYSEIPRQISASIYIYLASPAELLITDPMGRRLGKDQNSGVVYNEIPNSIYTYDEAIVSSELPINSNSTHKTKVIYIPSGDVGDYDVKVIGTGTGSYTVSTLIYDNQGNSHTKLLTGNTQPNLITDYDLNFTPDVPINIDFQLADTTMPVISHTQLNGQYLLNSTHVNFEFFASDSESGVSSISAKLDGVSMASGLPISFSQIGNHNIEITAQDFAGNILTETLNFEVIYDFSGFLSPIKIDGTGIYRLGRTLPIKFQLTDATNQYVYSVVSQLYIAKMQDGIVGTDEIALSTSNADSGNLFRYDDANNQYIYNLSTDSLSIGSWQLKAVLDDGRYYTVVISIR